MKMPTPEEIVKRGAFLYDGSVPCSVVIVQTSLRPGSGDADDPPEFRDDARGTFYELRYTPPKADRYLSAVVGFATVEAAVVHVESVVRGVSWNYESEHTTAEPSLQGLLRQVAGLESSRVATRIL
jgi:hypothetical protein